MNNTWSQSAGNEEILWLAGFVDGEGCLRLNPKKQGKWTSYVPIFQITNTHQPSIERIGNILSSLKVGRYLGTSQSKGNRKRYYYLRTEGLKRLGVLLPILEPYLYTKKIQAQLLLEFIQIRTAVSPNTPYGKREIEIYQQLKALNFRGSSETIRIPLDTVKI